MIRFITFLSILSNACHDPGPGVIMAIGDSNGAAKHGWVRQLDNKLINDSVYNYSVPGNTIGFDNLGNEKLNTLKNINGYLDDVLSKADKVDVVIILLGTNDCKAVFADREGEISQNMYRLINEIRSYPFPGKPPHDIVIVTPPPYGPDSVLAEKYVGGDKRVKRLLHSYKQVASELQCEYVDIYQPLKPRFNDYSKDGVHVSRVGQEIIAAEIIEVLNN